MFLSCLIAWTQTPPWEQQGEGPSPLPGCGDMRLGFGPHSPIQWQYTGQERILNLNLHQARATTPQLLRQISVK